MTERLAADPQQWTAGQLMRLIAENIESRDFEAVVALLHLLAIKDPHQAAEVHSAISVTKFLKTDDAGGLRSGLRSDP